MNFNNNKFILPSSKQVFGISKLNSIKALGTKCAISDLAIFEGYGYCVSNTDYIPGDKSLKGRTCCWGLSTVDNSGDVVCINSSGSKDKIDYASTSIGIRPIMSYSNISDISSNAVKEKNGLLEVEYGEYPQYTVDKATQEKLDGELMTGRIRKTGKTYTVPTCLGSTLTRFNAGFSANFNSIECPEYEYNGKKYIKIKCMGAKLLELSNGESYLEGEDFWLEVSPIKWVIDKKSKTMLSKICLASGVKYSDFMPSQDSDFKDTIIYIFLNKYFAKEIIPSTTHKNGQEAKYAENEKEAVKKRNPYELNFSKVSEEDIIRGAIESGIAVFLHGPSSEGKSARVKQIDPDCEIIYLRNATPESLNGKSVYNSESGKMIDIKPSWLRKIEEKCEKEPNRLHVIFFDEITNALPSIQGIAFNIVLDKEVNGIWKLPENARIVAAGNDMKDSLAANQLAEPLFNRFAHVYIKTTTESWLKWASENNIHPAIYSYIAYTKGEVLRRKYDGEKPNADPRKWEMASKMLYATGRPEMLRALIGEDITKAFVQFCNEQVITLDDVINGNYSERDIQGLNTAERYATTMGLSQVDDANLETVREFVARLGGEFRAIFDTLWTHGDDSKIERLAEAKLAETPEGGIRK